MHGGLSRDHRRWSGIEGDTAPAKFDLSDRRLAPDTVKNKTTELLDEIKEIKGLQSDYALAKLLQVRPQTIASYRKGRTQFSDEMALRATRVLGRAPAPLLAQLAAERAAHPDVKKVWEEASVTLASRPTKWKK
jgi:hypothetical protein